MNKDNKEDGEVKGAIQETGEAGKDGPAGKKQREEDPGAGKKKETKPREPSAGFPAGFGTAFSRYFFAGFTILVLVLSVLLIRPFITEIFLAFVLFILSKPIYDLFKRVFRGRKTISSIVTCVAIIIIVFIPFLAFAGVLASSAYDFYDYITREVQAGKLQQYLDIKNSSVILYLEEYIPAIANYDFNAGELAGKYLGTVSEFVYSNATSVVKGFSSVLIGFVLVIFIAFYMFIDGEDFLAELKRLSPLDDRYDQEIIDELIRTIKVTFKGSLVIAVVQGALGAIGFLICGIDSWALWGVVMAIGSLIPVVGTALIWVPAAIFLAVTKHFFAAGFLVVWGVIVIGLSDNLLRPYLMKGETNIHPLLIFFSVLGGIAYFGFLGIVLGPLILSLLIYVLRLYKKFINPEKTRQTS